MEPIKKVNVYETVASEIRGYIKLNDLKKGDKLPSEKQLADTLQIGRSSLRESLKFMEGMGLIEVKAGKGVFVKNPNKHIMPLSDITEKESFLQIMEIREMIEMKVMELAVERATEDDLEAIEKALIVVEEKSKHSISANEEDLAFHRAVYESAKNPMILHLIKAMGDVYHKPWRGTGDEVGLFYSTIKYHRLLYLAIKNRDLEAGRDAVTELIKDMKDNIMEYWSD